MPIIDNNAIPMPDPEDGRSARRFVTKEAGAVNVTVGELVMQDGAVLRLHTHPTDEAIVLLDGQVEMVVGQERRLVTPGHTFACAPGNTPPFDQQYGRPGSHVHHLPN